MATEITTGLPHWTIVGFTGHRVLSNTDQVAEAIERALSQLAQRSGAIACVGSAARGADTLVIEHAAKRGIPLMVVLPFDVSRFKQDFSPHDWARVEPNLASAVERTIVPATESDNEAYLEAGVYTVDSCDVLLAVWNGKPAAGRGGTGDVVQYAESCSKPIIVIDPRTAKINAQRLDRLPRGTHCPSTDSASFREQVESHFHGLDKHAVGHAPRARLILQRIILLHLLASSIAIVGLGLGAVGAWAYIVGSAKVAALLWAVVLVSRHHKAHHAWVEARPAAELCRSFLALWHLRRDGAILPRVPAGPLSRLARDLKVLWLLDRNAAVPLEEARDRYLHQRIDGQRGYYSGEYAKASRRHLLLRRMALAGTWSAIAAGVFAIVLLAGQWYGVQYHVAKLLSILLPLATTALLSLAASLDLNRRADRYSEMQSRLDDAAKRVAAAQTWPGLWRAVADIEHQLLEEVDEWRSIARFTGESH